MQGITKFSATGAPREVAPRTFRFVASTGERDRDGDMIEPSGWKLDNYLRNPVILLGHDYGSAPVARASRVWVERGSLMVDVLFPSVGASEASDEAFALVAEGFLRAVSVGFRPLEREPLSDGRGFRYTSVELLEISLVSVPSNASALLAARFGGKSGPDFAKAQLRELLAKAGARRARDPFASSSRRYYRLRGGEILSREEIEALVVRQVEAVVNESSELKRLKIAMAASVDAVACFSQHVGR